MLELANAYIDQYDEHDQVVPTAAGLAGVLNVSKATIYKWAEDITEFSDTLGNLNRKQEQILINKGITGEFNSVITKLMLHNHGYSDKAEIDNKHDISVVEIKKDFD